VNSNVKIRSRFLYIFILILVISVSGCSSATLTTTPTASSEPDTFPSPTPTPVPLGEPDNPLVIGWVDITTDSASEIAINELLDSLNSNSEVTVAFQVFPGDQELYAALENREIQAAWLQPLTYIRAHENDLAEVSLLSNHFGTYFYGTQFLANAESGLISYFDPTANKSTGDLLGALAQLDGKRPCWVEPGSISGYILPLGLLEEANIQVQQGVLSQSYTAVIRSLYIKGICDFGATFSISGDPRTSSSVLDDLPDAVERVVVIWQSEAVIPNLNFSISPLVEDELRRPIIQSLIDIVKTEEGKRNLTLVLNNYEIQDLKVVDDSIYDPIRTAVQFSNTDLSKWIGR
jgi:phosphonate transport system substrate-binding protein